MERKRQYIGWVKEPFPWLDLWPETRRYKKVHQSQGSIINPILWIQQQTIEVLSCLVFDLILYIYR
ncbi:unnamed protein product [Musa acuminata subsp. malaccensis]|jgi:hypothetical protein|uniref:Uncharacterized protein n=1 Tax=Musa acuminata subsp. malaccensis TaxID=214687 RepID=A0A804JKF5_MUSAM|nr:unnamed protein product [Musa acuminata subsp. malaccensis]CAG1865866.1 unnamed protein product [Musa acuminata subsp. malaccensis]